ncbi:MAG: hypothetical protein R2770_18675 [Acidimicrobiales bacterium]
MSKTAPTSETFPRQHARTRRFTLGAPRSFDVSSDGRRVFFCRSKGGDDPQTCLWVLDAATGQQTLLVDPGSLDIDDSNLTAAERARRERREQAGEWWPTRSIRRGRRPRSCWEACPSSPTRPPALSTGWR